MTEIRTKSEIDKIREAGKIVAECHKEIERIIKPGITTFEIDRFAESFILKNKATPEQKGYMGYPFATCASVNDVICHGFPNDIPLKNGDVVKIDMVVNLNGWLGDSAWTYTVGNISEEARHLIYTTKKCLFVGIEKALKGNRIGDISHKISSIAHKEGFSVVREYTGHGIGRVMHDGLIVPHHGKAGRGPRIYEGMVFTIEPMINTGTWKSKLDDDGWTARTEDGGLSAQYEHTIAITKNGPEILTML